MSVCVCVAASPGTALPFVPYSKAIIRLTEGNLVLVTLTKHTMFVLYIGVISVKKCNCEIYHRELTSLDVLKGFITFLKAHCFPLVGFIQIHGCNDRQGHVDHVLLTTA